MPYRKLQDSQINESECLSCSFAALGFRNLLATSLVRELNEHLYHLLLIPFEYNLTEIKLTEDLLVDLVLEEGTQLLCRLYLQVLRPLVVGLRIPLTDGYPTEGLTMRFLELTTLLGNAGDFTDQFMGLKPLEDEMVQVFVLKTRDEVEVLRHFFLGWSS